MWDSLLVRGTPGQLPPPVDDMTPLWSPVERAHVARMTRCSAVGSPEIVRNRLQQIADETGADELILTAHIHDHAARMRSFEIAMAARNNETNHRGTENTKAE